MTNLHDMALPAIEQHIRAMFDPTLSPENQKLEQILQLAAECQYDPYKWAMYAYDWGHGLLADEELRQWQAELLKYIRDQLQNRKTRYQIIRVSRSTGHGVGKSAAFGILCNWAMSCHELARVTITANTERQLRTKTSVEVRKWFNLSITNYWFDASVMAITAKDKHWADSWRVDFHPWSEHNTEAFQGLHNKRRIILLLMDEASGIADTVMNAAQGALTDEKTIIIWLQFGNPTQTSGFFRETFRRFRHRWNHASIDARDVPGTNKELFKQWEQDYSVDSDFFKVRVRGIFPSQAPRQFISADLVDPAIGKVLRPEQYDFAPKILTCDPAWTGDDELVIGLRQGLQFRVLFTMPRNDNDVWVANKLASLEDEHEADAVFVDAGYGTGIVSAGTTMGRNWRLVWFGGSPIDPGCFNKRSEMWREVREWLRKGGALPPDETLRLDLTSPETLPRLDGKIALETKEMMRERGLPSPNRGDALALSFAEPVTKKERRVPSRERRAGKKQRNALDEYNPFANADT